MNNRRGKRESTEAFTQTAHIISYLLATIVFIVCSLTGRNNDFLAGTILMRSLVPAAALLILIDIYFYCRSHRTASLPGWNLLKYAALFAVNTMALLYCQDGHLWLFSAIYLLPVALACITLGRRWGFAFAGAATTIVILLARVRSMDANQAMGMLQGPFIFGFIFFLLAWLLGSIIEAEKNTAERLRQERDLIARIMDTSPAGIMVLDSHGKIVYANARTEQILGLKQDMLQEMFNGEPEGDISFPPREVFQNVVSRGEPAYNCPGTVSRAGEGSTYLSVSGAPIFGSSGHLEQVVLTVDDITRQKMMTEEMLKADKLESLTLLAGGIAHDFNNFLAVILGNISLIKLRPLDEKTAKHIEYMEKTILQARDLTRKLFIFSRGGAPVRKVVHLQKLLLDTVGFALSGSEILYQIEVDEALWPVEVDETQIVQVFNNILINAVQAMPGGGKIVLTAANIANGDTGRIGKTPLKEGNYVCVSIADQGIGIPPDKISKIFDPLFSTKPQGSGLGLATAFMVIQNHGGVIDVESEPGVGTTFYVYLPAASAAAPVPAEESEELFYTNCRVLVMEDGELLRKACGEMLQHLGCQVSFARDGAEAVRLYREAAENGEKFDVVIMDLTIPGGSGGLETIARLQLLDPAVKAIVSSGYSNAPVITDYKEYGFSGFISKPYRLKELSAALKSVLA